MQAKASACSPRHPRPHPASARSPGATYDVKTSVVEIYCEKIRDLLGDASQDNLQVKQDAARGIFIEGALAAGSWLLSRPRALAGMMVMMMMSIADA